MCSGVFRNCRIGVFQYVIIHIITSLLTFVTDVRAAFLLNLMTASQCRCLRILVLCSLQLAGVYGEGEISNFEVAYPYLTIVNNLSQLVRHVLSFVPCPLVYAWREWFAVL